MEGRQGLDDGPDVGQLPPGGVRLPPRFLVVACGGWRLLWDECLHPLTSMDMLKLRSPV